MARPGIERGLGAFGPAPTGTAQTSAGNARAAV